MKYKTSVIIMQNAFQIVILFEFKFWTTEVGVSTIIVEFVMTVMC